MSIVNSLIEIQLKLKKYKLQFAFLFLFWLSGLIFFLISEPDHSVYEVFLFSITVRSPDNGGDYANFYMMVWPILLEVIVFGFIMVELLEKYNPVITSRILASHKKDHTVLIGFQHLSERIIEHCIENHSSFCIIEDHLELVEDLINSGTPVVVGDPTDDVNLKAAKIDRAKEVFITIDDVRIAIICTEKIRKLNQECPIYVRIFEDHNQEFLKEQSVNVFPFSTSKWTMEQIAEWTKNKTGKSIVIGRDTLSHRIAYHISNQENCEVFLFDDIHDGIEFYVNEHLHIIQEFVCFLSDIKPHIDLTDVSQIFICWTDETEFDEAIYLASKINLRFPETEIYVRIFDEELVELVEKFNAKTFSSSANAFKRLQKIVNPNSSIFDSGKKP